MAQLLHWVNPAHEGKKGSQEMGYKKKSRGAPQRLAYAKFHILPEKCEKLKLKLDQFWEFIKKNSIAFFIEFIPVAVSTM